MALNIVNMYNWIFENKEEEANLFFSEIFENKLRYSDSCKIRSIDDLNKIDTDFIKKHYHCSSQKSIDDLKSNVKASYVGRIFTLKYIDWYIAKPIGKNGCDSYRQLFALYIPNTETFDEVKTSLLDYTKPCFSCDYLQLIDMTDGKQNNIFIGGLDEPEPNCKPGCKHDWNWNVYHKDCLENYVAECKNCGIIRSKTIGDKRNFQWNENHGWRYRRPSAFE